MHGLLLRVVAFAAGLLIAVAIMMLGPRIQWPRRRSRPGPPRRFEDQPPEVRLGLFADECPFALDRRYRVTRDIVALRDSFRVGEQLVFLGIAHSAYHGMKGYFFRDDAGAHRSFDVPDDATNDDWQSAFELIAEDARD